MSCSAFVAKGLNSLDYDTNVKNFLPKDVFLLVKKGKNAFPMGKSMEASTYEADFRSWMLDLCKARTETIATSLEFLDTLRRAETVEDLAALRGPIVALRESLVADYKRFLSSVSKAAQYIPNPVLSSMLIGLGVAKSENLFYKQVHDALFDIQKAVEGSLTSAIDRIDRLIRNKENAAMRNARARSNAAAAARHQERFNTIGARLGLPAGTKPLNVLTAWKNKTVRGGRRKTKLQKGGTPCIAPGFIRGQRNQEAGSIFSVSDMEGSLERKRSDLIYKEVEDGNKPNEPQNEFDNDAWHELDCLTHAAEHGLTPAVLSTLYCGYIDRVECYTPRRGDPQLIRHSAWTGSFVQEKVQGPKRDVPQDIANRLVAQLQAIGIRNFDDTMSNFMYGSTTSHPDPKWWVIDFGFARRERQGGKRKIRRQRSKKQTRKTK